MVASRAGVLAMRQRTSSTRGMGGLRVLAMRQRTSSTRGMGGLRCVGALGATNPRLYRLFRDSARREGAPRLSAARKISSRRGPTVTLRALRFSLHSLVIKWSEKMPAWAHSEQ